jgi:hypothetical protein
MPQQWFVGRVTLCAARARGVLLVVSKATHICLEMLPGLGAAVIFCVIHIINAPAKATFPSRFRVDVLLYLGAMNPSSGTTR